MPTAEAIARYFLHLAALTDEPSPVSQMQLHKLLYYAQGWSLATRETPLFPARFEAWVHGPVEVDLYPVFADYGSQPIAPHEAREDPSLLRPDRGFLESIWLSFGKYAAWQLREMTHGEAPWKDARASAPRDPTSRAPITEAAMRAYFYALHDSRCRKMGFTAAELAEDRRALRQGRGTPLEELRAEFMAEANQGNAAEPRKNPTPAASRADAAKRAG